jgi:hypothetical protein
MAAGRRTYKGVFKPTNPKKYRGNVDNIVFRSSWELKLMNALDNNPNVVMWASEEMHVPYISPIDDRIHRYFPDFLIGLKKADGTIHRMMVEVKPAYQTEPPKPKKKITPSMINEMKTWQVNKAKWEAARRFCDEVGWEFKIATEHELNIT